MTDEKYLWKVSYIWIRYYHYHCVHYDKERGEVWLAHKQKQHMVIFKQGNFTTQELEFEKQRILEHQESVNAYLSMSIQCYDVYVLTDKAFNPVVFNQQEPIKIKFHAIDQLGQFSKKMAHPIAKWQLLRQDHHPSTFYQRRVLNGNIIEQAMYQFTPVTYSLIGINLLVWLIITFFLPHRSDIEIINLGALAHFNVVHGEWYRLFSSMFLHLDIEHLILNMMSLYIFGKLLESHIHSLKTLGIYLLSGLIGNIFSLALITASFSVGASGAIFGLLGGLIALVMISQRYTRKTAMQLIIAAVFMAVITLLVRNVNIVAHLGGLLGGLVTVYLGYYFQMFKKRFYIILALTVVLIMGLIIKIFITPSENIYNQIIQDQMKNNNYNEAKHMVSQTIDNNYADDSTYYLSGMIIAAQDSKAEAIAEWERGLKLHPESIQLNYIMAVANRSLGDQKSARQYIKKAAHYAPNNDNIKTLKQELDE
ncbi:rhomboid family intramembrane serine protease [Staphylococcus sp. 17KM0847]|uniref:rhomboid family intramembrane serine protease n=1 Tax=Staphylococcus sp. 17KM0847 TaxID=2583989 RepID=UPI0015DC6865|nr:rhomboid family intramembrane serine protease [Staphylococcus sp. 17KM0847]QLK86070.1 rhomboid family intramembrane serine protease [Staphylococcus sp. 17KM0847]